VIGKHEISRLVQKNFNDLKKFDLGRVFEALSISDPVALFG
jgi:hypothetical protein